MREAGISEYEDIIGLPHHVSASHPQMSPEDRAAQFSPFAALTGYEDAIDESARLTEDYIELDENSRELLDEKIHELCGSAESRKEIAITYFRKDERKAGGTYVTITGRIKRIDGERHEIVLVDGTVLRTQDILSIEY